MEGQGARYETVLLREADFGFSDDRCDVQSEIQLHAGGGVRCYGTARV